MLDNCNLVSVLARASFTFDMSEIICKNGSSEFYPNSTLKAVYWFVSVLFLVD